MVKGVTRRVIMLKLDDEKLFEQAFFIVRGSVLEEKGYSSEDVLREARRVAEDYARKHAMDSRRLINIPAPYFAAMGAAVTGFVWLLTRLI